MRADACLEEDGVNFLIICHWLQGRFAIGTLKIKIRDFKKKSQRKLRLSLCNFDSSLCIC